MSNSKKAPRALPVNPSLENLKKQARKLQKQVRTGVREALTRVRAHHPRLAAGGKLDLERFSLSDAQLVVAREYGFLSYPKLKTHVERTARDAGRKPALADAGTFPWVQRPGLVWSKASADHACDRLYERLTHLAHGKAGVSKQELMRLRQARELPALIGLAARQCDPAAQQALLELSDPRTLVERLCALLDWIVGQQRPEPWGDGYLGDEGLERKHEAACVAVLYAAGHPHLLGRRYSLAAPKTSLGRDAGNQVVLPSDAVSRLHACIEREGDDYVLVDQESTNGTFVNELPDRIEQHVLADGDRFALGATVLIFLNGDDRQAKYRAAVDNARASARQ